VLLYNDYAHRLKFRPYKTRSAKVDRRIYARVEDIGGFENFERALSAIPTNDFYMGRMPPKPGKKPFRLHIDFLLSETSGCGDVLAGLVDLALDAGSGGDDIEARVDKMAASPGGKSVINRFGLEEGRERIRAQILGEAKQ
jgi:hypothetical protein